MRQGQILVGATDMRGVAHWPDRYFTPSNAGTRYDGDPGPCICACHDLWRAFTKTYLR